MTAVDEEDFAKCMGYGCPLASTCKRATQPSNGDRVFRGVPFKVEEGMVECVRWIDKNDTFDKIVRKMNGSL